MFMYGKDLVIEIIYYPFNLHHVRIQKVRRITYHSIIIKRKISTKDPICTSFSMTFLEMFFLYLLNILWNLKSAEFQNFLSKLSCCALAVLGISFYYIVDCYSLYLQVNFKCAMWIYNFKQRQRRIHIQFLKHECMYKYLNLIFKKNRRSWRWQFRYMALKIISTWNKEPLIHVRTKQGETLFCLFHEWVYKSKMWCYDHYQ